jgi:hypothetical protein
VFPEIFEREPAKVGVDKRLTAIVGVDMRINSRSRK